MIGWRQSWRQEKKQILGLEVLTVVNMNITVIWNMASCGQAETYQHVGRNPRLHVEGEQRAVR